MSRRAGVIGLLACLLLAAVPCEAVGLSVATWDGAPVVSNAGATDFENEPAEDTCLCLCLSSAGSMLPVLYAASWVSVLAQDSRGLLPRGACCVREPLLRSVFHPPRQA